MIRWDEFRKYPTYPWPFPRKDLRELQKHPFCWTELQNRFVEPGLLRLTSAEHTVAAGAMVADSKRVVRFAVIDSLPGDSATVKRILESVRLVPYEH